MKLDYKYMVKMKCLFVYQNLVSPSINILGAFKNILILQIIVRGGHSFVDPFFKLNPIDHFFFFLY